MSTVAAWLLDLGGGLHAAVGEREMLHVLPDSPRLYEIPRSPPYCRKVLIWQGEILPVMDLARRLSVHEATAAQSPPLIVITAFQEQQGVAPRHGALLLGSAPARIRVSDAQACELPQPQSRWRSFAIACFEHADRGAVPVVDLGRIFLLP